MSIMVLDLHMRSRTKGQIAREGFKMTKISLPIFDDVGGNTLTYQEILELTNGLINLRNRLGPPFLAMIRVIRVASVTQFDIHIQVVLDFAISPESANKHVVEGVIDLSRSGFSAIRTEMRIHSLLIDLVRSYSLNLRHHSDELDTLYNRMVGKS